MKLFRSRAEREREQLLADREWQFDALANHAFHEITKSPGATHHESPIVNSYSTHTRTSGLYTVPDGYPNDTANTIALGVAYDKWGNIPSVGESTDLPPINRLTVRFGSAALLYAQAHELDSVPETISIEVAKNDLLEPATMERLAQIEIAIKAAMASTRDEEMPMLNELRTLTDTRIAKNYKNFMTAEAVETMLEAAEKARIDALQPKGSPDPNGWNIYADAPDPVPVSKPPVSEDEKANVAILIESAAATTTRKYNKPKSPRNNGYNVEVFHVDHETKLIPSEHQNLIIGLAYAQANHTEQGSVRFSDRSHKINQLRLVNRAIKKLPIGDAAAELGLLLTEDAYLQTAETHPEWFLGDTLGIGSHKPTLYWMTGSGDSLKIHCNSSTLPANNAIRELLRWSNHIGMRNMVIGDVMPKLTALSFIRRNQRPGYTQTNSRKTSGYKNALFRY